MEHSIASMCSPLIQSSERTVRLHCCAFISPNQGDTIAAGRMEGPVKLTRRGLWVRSIPTLSFNLL